VGNTHNGTHAMALADGAQAVLLYNQPASQWLLEGYDCLVIWLYGCSVGTN
jgi:hypothetical protein